MVCPSYVRKLRFNDVGFWFFIMRYFVLLSNYVTLGLQKHVFLIKSFFRTLWRRVESTSQLSCVLFCQFAVSFPTLELSYKSFSYNKIFFMTLGLRSVVVSWITYGSIVWNNVWKLRFVFLRDCDAFFISSQLRYLFVWCNYVFWWR